MNRAPGNRIAQLGFTLVELLVGMVIGLFIAGGLIAIVVTSTSAYNVQIDHARVNENARFAVEFLSRDVRMAGYFGCLDNPANVINNLNASDGSLYDFDEVIEGFEGNASETTWLPSGSAVSALNIFPGTDAITVRFANPTESAVLDGVSTPDSAIPASNAGYDFDTGQVAVVSDCDKADVFQITSTDADNNLGHANSGASPGNVSGSLGGGLGDGYDTTATVMTYNAVRYFVRKRDTSDTGDDAALALYREYVSGTGATVVEPVIEGVENMQILYGVDTDADGVANSYLTANNVGTWRNVVSVQIGLLVRSNEEYGREAESSGAAESYTYTLLGQDITDSAKLRVRRHQYSTTIALRNGR